MSELIKHQSLSKEINSFISISRYYETPTSEKGLYIVIQTPENLSDI